MMTDVTMILSTILLQTDVPAEFGTQVQWFITILIGAITALAGAVVYLYRQNQTKIEELTNKFAEQLELTRKQLLEEAKANTSEKLALQTGQITDLKSANNELVKANMSLGEQLAELNQLQSSMKNSMLVILDNQREIMENNR